MVWFYPTKQPRTGGSGTYVANAAHIPGRSNRQFQLSNPPACRHVWLEGVVLVSVIGLYLFLCSLAVRFCFVWIKVTPLQVLQAQVIVQVVVVVVEVVVVVVVVVVVIAVVVVGGVVVVGVVVVVRVVVVVVVAAAVVVVVVVVLLPLLPPPPPRLPLLTTTNHY